MDGSQTMDHGRWAERPGQLHKGGWRDVLWRVKSEQTKDNLSIVAAGVAFYGFLAIFPALAAIISIYGLVADPADVQRQMSQFSGIMPSQVSEILNNQLSRLAQGSSTALSWGLAGSILLTIWSANKGMKALITALNVAYDEEERRGFFKLNGISLLLTVGAILFFIVTVGLIAAVPLLMGNLGLPDWVQTAVQWLRWPVLALAVIFSLAVLYRYAPDRREARWRWVNPGAITATVLWLIASGLFAWYVANFGDYNKTYGSVGAVVVLLLWFFLTSYLFLLGAEMNAEMEHQTRRDTTEGGEQPMGARDAQVADTVGESP